MRREPRGAVTRERAERETRERAEHAAERKRQRRAKRERAAAVSQAASRRRSREEGRRARSLRSSGKTQHDRAGHARHEGPALFLSGSVSLNPIVRGPFDHEHLGRSSSTRHQAQSPPLPSPPCLSLWQEAARLLRGGAPRRFPTTASPDPREVRRGHSSFPLARGPPTTSTPAEAQSGIRLNPLPSPPCLSLAGAARLLRGGAPRRLLAAASPDPCVVRRGHSSFPPARGQQYCIRGRHRPRARSLCARSACGPENRGRLGRGAERGLA